jgi:hypothetical protein
MTMKQKILESLDARMKELARMKYDPRTTERHRAMASGAWAELKLVAAEIKKMTE